METSEYYEINNRYANILHDCIKLNDMELGRAYSCMMVLFARHLKSTCDTENLYMHKCFAVAQEMIGLWNDEDMI